MKPFRSLMVIFLMVLATAFSVQAALPVGTWNAPGDFEPGTWKEILRGGGEGAEGNEITAFSDGYYIFEDALLVGKPLLINSGKCAPDVIAEFETTYLGGTLILITDDPDSPWFINASADPYIVNLTKSTVRTCKYPGDALSFTLQSEGGFQFPLFPTYLAEISAEYRRGTPKKENGNLSSMSDDLSFAQINIIGPSPAAVDIKPGSCPNPINVKSQGVIPMAILGGQNFDVRTIDKETIFLTNGVSVDGELIKVAPIRLGLEYVGKPYNPLLPKNDRLDCTSEISDGHLDLTLKFDTQEVVTAFDLLKETPDRSTQEWFLMFKNNGGKEMIGSDIVWILNRTQNGNNGNHYGRIRHKGY